MVFLQVVRLMPCVHQEQCTTSTMYLHHHPRAYLYTFSVEWHMQLMQWLPGKCCATDCSRPAWKVRDSAGPPPPTLPAAMGSRWCRRCQI